MIRKLLLPFSWIYGLALRFRHALYDRGIWKSRRSAITTIAIGNLALGGTGKTPMLELLLSMLHDVDVATLSRGYGRKGNELREVSSMDDPAMSGDEPLQVKRKFPHVRVFVGADRVKALEQIRSMAPEVRVVVLDDALQHRRLVPDLKILLTTYHRPYFTDALLPVGTLRDLAVRARYADVVVVTKCPAPPPEEDQLLWRRKLGLDPAQELYFSGIEYTDPKDLRSGAETGPLKEQNLLLVTGIADPAPLLAHLRPRCRQLGHVAFPDHHRFTPGDGRALAAQFSKFAPAPKLLITTEKDATRLSPVINDGPLQDVPLAVIGMRTVIYNGPERFSALIKAYAGKNTKDS